jgi:hypothetical protein
MPNTVTEFVKRNKQFQTTPTGQKLSKVLGNPDAINQITEQQEHDDAVMKALIQEQDQRLQKHVPEDADPELLNVYAHRRGVAGAIKASKDGSYKNDPYVKKYVEEKAKKFPQLMSYIKKPEVE